jgi:hypothetical protein
LLRGHIFATLTGSSELQQPSKVFQAWNITEEHLGLQICARSTTPRGFWKAGKPFSEWRAEVDIIVFRLHKGPMSIMFRLHQGPICQQYSVYPRGRYVNNIPSTQWADANNIPSTQGADVNIIRPSMAILPCTSPYIITSPRDISFSMTKTNTFFRPIIRQQKPDSSDRRYQGH